MVFAFDFRFSLIANCCRELSAAKERPLPNRSVEKTGILTEQQLQFIACWQGSAVAAAAAAGYKDPVNAGYKLMQLEPIREGIRMKQNAIAEETGRALGKQIAVCRADVINRLWDLAMMDPDNTKE